LPLTSAVARALRRPQALAGGVAPSEVYGAEHLVRLLVKLPELVPVVMMAGQVRSCWGEGSQLRRRGARRPARRRCHALRSLLAARVARVRHPPPESNASLICLVRFVTVQGDARNVVALEGHLHDFMAFLCQAQAKIFSSVDEYKPNPRWTPPLLVAALAGVTAAAAPPAAAPPPPQETAMVQ
jgi:hypothetical protein